MTAVSSANTWSPNAGKLDVFVGQIATAKGIHERLGADVAVLQTQTGGFPMTVIYVMSFESGAAYGAFIDALAEDDEWQQFWATATADPSAELVQSAMLSAIEM
jgi:hypothetical protein